MSAICSPPIFSPSDAEHRAARAAAAFGAANRDRPPVSSSTEPASFGFPAGLPFLDKMPTGLLCFTGTLELVGGFLILIGLFTRPVAFILSGFMAAAYFMAHFPMSFFPAINMGEPAVLFRFIFLFLAAAGPARGRPTRRDGTRPPARVIAPGPPPGHEKRASC